MSNEDSGEGFTSSQTWKQLLNEHLHGNGSRLGPVANLCSATLGAGVLALPFAISKAGIFLGIFLLVIAASSTILSIDMLVLSCAVSKQNSYEKLTVALFGTYMGWIVELSILFFCFGICVAYIVAVGDILEQGVLGSLQNFQLPTFVTREFIMILFWALVMFPLSLFEKINALRFASLFGVSSIFFLVFAVSFHSIRALMNCSRIPDSYMSTLQNHDDDHNNTTVNTIRMWPDSFVDAIQACPIILFAFNCQINVPAIFEELPPSADVLSSSLTKMKGITRIAIRICFCLYVVMGTLAYVEFGGKTQDNVLKNYCVQITHDPLMIMAFCGITLSVVLAFPLNVFPSRITLDIIVTRMFDQKFFNRCRSSQNEESGSIEVPLLQQSIFSAEEGSYSLGESDVLQSPSQTPLQIPSQNLPPATNSRQKHILLTVVISGSALIVAIIVPDISIVFGLLGGFASSLTGLIMPASFYLRLGLAEDNKKKNLFAWTLVCGGALIGILSTGVTIYSIFQNQQKQNVCESMHNDYK